MPAIQVCETHAFNAKTRISQVGTGGMKDPVPNDVHCSFKEGKYVEIRFGNSEKPIGGCK